MFDARMHLAIEEDARNGDATHAHLSGGQDGRWASMKFTELVALLGVALPPELRAVDVSFPVRRVRVGEALCRAGDAFKAIYVVRSGFLKAVSIDPTGAELVLGFPMCGDVIGIDGIDAERYQADAIALDVSSVVAIPFAQLSGLARQYPGIERLLYSIFSRELAHRQSMLWLLGMLSAEARLASFLIETSERFGRLGFSRHAFTLRATRQEIGSYLGLKLETVSRTLSAFAQAGLIDVDRRDITLRDVAGLRCIISPRAEPEAPKAVEPARVARRVAPRRAHAPWCGGGARDGRVAAARSFGAL